MAKPPQYLYTENLGYLATHGYKGTKPLNQAQAQRQANMLRRALTRGEVAPTKAELRGHPGRGIRKDFDKRTQISYRWLDSPLNNKPNFETEDLSYLLKNSPKHKGDHTLLIVTGIVTHGSENDPDAQSGDRRTYAYGPLTESVHKWIKDNPQIDLIHFFHRFNPDIVWLSLEAVGLYYPRGKR